MRIHKRKFLLYIVLFLIVAISVELLSYLFGQYGILKSRGSFLLADPRVSMTQSEIEKYFSSRDPILGWPSPDLLGTDDFDINGARPSPAYPQPGSAQVSLYGDSFTYGSDVDHEHAWGNVLSRHLGNRVANYGVPGYGTDQAYLRFQKNIDDESKIVILGFIGDNITRIINQDRRLVWKPYGGLKLKPRFILNENNQLAHIPIPPITQELTPDYLAHPEKYLEHEWFLPGSGYGGVTFEFPFTISIAQALIEKRAINFYLNRPYWFEYFSDTHESQALPLLVRIISSFDELAAERDKRLLLVILPSARHLMYQKANRISPVKLLTERLNDEDISYLDVTGHVLNELDGRKIDQIFTKQFILNDRGGHYNDIGNEIIAGIIKRYLEQSYFFGEDRQP